MNFLAKILIGALSIWPVLSLPAFAMSCGDRNTLEQQLEKADVVFEGHFSRYGMLRMNELATERRFNFNKPGFYVLTTTFKADKGWKGMKNGEEATTIFAWPIPAEIKGPVLRKVESDNKYKGQGRKIFALAKPKYDPKVKTAISVENPQQYEKYYYDTLCDGEYALMPENLKILQKKFPQGSAQ